MNAAMTAPGIIAALAPLNRAADYPAVAASIRAGTRPTINDLLRLEKSANRRLRRARAKTLGSRQYHLFEQGTESVDPAVERRINELTLCKQALRLVMMGSR
jgi:hypothetical protein